MRIHTNLTKLSQNFDQNLTGIYNITQAECKKFQYVLKTASKSSDHFIFYKNLFHIIFFTVKFIQS